MKKKGFYTTLFVIILGLISIYLFSILDMQLKESAKRVDIVKYNIYRTLEVLVLIIFGILIEYKKLFSIFKNGVSINKIYLIIAISLVILLILPYGFKSNLWIGHSFPIKRTIFLILNIMNTRSVLSVFTGILLVRSLSGSEPIKE